VPPITGSLSCCSSLSTDSLCGTEFAKPELLYKNAARLWCVLQCVFFCFVLSVPDPKLSCTANGAVGTGKLRKDRLVRLSSVGVKVLGGGRRVLVAQEIEPLETSLDGEIPSLEACCVPQPTAAATAVSSQAPRSHRLVPIGALHPGLSGWVSQRASLSCIFVVFVCVQAIRVRVVRRPPVKVYAGKGGKPGTVLTVHLVDADGTCPCVRFPNSPGVAGDEIRCTMFNDVRQQKKNQPSRPPSLCLSGCRSAANWNRGCAWAIA